MTSASSREAIKYNDLLDMKCANSLEDFGARYVMELIFISWILCSFYGDLRMGKVIISENENNKNCISKLIL